MTPCSKSIFVVFCPQKSMNIVVLPFTKSMDIDVFYIKNKHLATDVPNKVKTTSSENTPFANSEHPYRTSGLSAGSFD